MVRVEDKEQRWDKYKSLKELGDTGVIRNHAEVTGYLKNMNVKTVLHGHKHFDIERPFISEDYYQNSNSIIDVFSAGSLATNRKDKHTFSIIDFYDKNSEVKLMQKKFVYNEEKLDIVEKQIPPKNSADKVVKLLDMLKTNCPDDEKNIQNVLKSFLLYTKIIAKLLNG